MGKMLHLKFKYRKYNSNLKYNPQTGELFTDDGTFLKRLHCPFSKNWEDLIQSDLLKGRLCDQCQRTVLDTSLFEDEVLRQVITSDPQTCLKVDLNQSNLTITYQTHANKPQ